MTNKLVELLRETFPAPSNIDTYASTQRIYLNLRKQNKKHALTNKRIQEITQTTFTDIDYELTTKGDWGYGIFFTPQAHKATSQADLRRIDNYAEHHILLQDYNVGDITITTGNRGADVLHDKQRKQYFTFIKELYKHL